jgi:hypothetical protein
LRLPSCALPFSFDRGRKLQPFRLFAMVSAAPWRWSCVSRRGSAGHFAGPLAVQQNCAIRRGSILFSFCGFCRLCSLGLCGPGACRRHLGRDDRSSESGCHIDLVVSRPFAREFAAEREKRSAYKKYLLNAFTVAIVMAAGAAALIDIVALFSSK